MSKINDLQVVRDMIKTREHQLGRKLVGVVVVSQEEYDAMKFAHRLLNDEDWVRRRIRFDETPNADGREVERFLDEDPSA